MKKSTKTIIGFSIIYASLFLLFIYFTVADTYSNGTTFTPTLNNVTYFVPYTNLLCTNISVGTVCVNITGGSMAYNHCDVFISQTNKTLCGDDTDCLYNVGTICMSGLCELGTRTTIITKQSDYTTMNSVACNAGEFLINNTCYIGKGLTYIKLEKVNNPFCDKISFLIQPLDQNKNVIAIDKMQLFMAGQLFNMTKTTFGYTFTAPTTITNDINVAIIGTQLFNGITNEARYDYNLTYSCSDISLMNENQNIQSIQSYVGNINLKASGFFKQNYKAIAGFLVIGLILAIVLVLTFKKKQQVIINA